MLESGHLKGLPAVCILSESTKMIYSRPKASHFDVCLTDPLDLGKDVVHVSPRHTAGPPHFIVDAVQDPVEAVQTTLKGRRVFFLGGRSG